MQRMLITAVAVTVVVGCCETKPETDQPQILVGEIKIIGNTVTPDHFIRERVEIYPGQRLSAMDLINGR